MYLNNKRYYTLDKYYKDDLDKKIISKKDLSDKDRMIFILSNNLINE